VVRGFLLDPPPVQRPVIALRRAQLDDHIPACWPRDPVLRDTLAKLDWDALLARRPGWSWDSSSGELVCENGRLLALSSVRSSENAPGRTGIILRRPSWGCDICEPRLDCLRAERIIASKHVELSVPSPVADQARARLTLLRSAARRPAAFAAVTAEAGPCAVADALFLPAASRQVFRALFSGGSLRVEVGLPPPPPPHPRLVAVDVADRQRRRKTWAQNVAR